MTWWKFYDRYSNWNESTIKTCISTLSEIGTGDEVVDVVQNLDNQDLKEQLIRKSLHLGVEFSQDDFMNLDGELSDALYARVAKYGDFYFDNPYFDPDDFAWDDFYTEYSSLPEHILRKCVKTITNFGPNEEVAEVIIDLDDDLAEILYKRARELGFKFSYAQLDEIESAKSFPLYEEKVTIIDCTGDGEDIFSELGRAAQGAADSINKLADDIERLPKKKKLGFWGALAALLGSSSSSSHSSDNGGFATKKKHSGRCDGDCANCPAHYGYRYGRWYYGHAHQHGCEFGGNGGAKGKCYRD